MIQTHQGLALKSLPAGSNQTSELIEAGTASHGSFQAVWSGLTGVLNAVVKVQVSNDNGLNWVDKPSATMTLTSAAGSDIINLSGTLSEEKVRVVYTSTGVTGGVISCTVILKG
jgi:hypothetical protein